MRTNERITVLGLGNPLCGDDGFGSHAAQMLLAACAFPQNCQVVDGGTQGQILYGLVTEATKLLLLDAARLELEPGSLALRQAGEIPAWLGARKLSAHQGSFAEVLALARLKNSLTPEIRLIAFEPVSMEFGQPLSPQAAQALPKAIHMALACLEEWGIKPENRQDAPDPLGGSIAHHAFMPGRP